MTIKNKRKSVTLNGSLLADGDQVTLEIGIAELHEMEDDDLRDAMIGLAKGGLIAPSGERRDGRVVWVATPRRSN